MESDEQAIRDLIATWQEASAEGDLETVLGLMSEDVVFLTVGNEPMRGRDAFAAVSKGLRGRFRLTAEQEIGEVAVQGDWAYCWTKLAVTVTPAEGGAPMRRTGHTLSIFRREPDGRWVLARDANLLIPDAEGSPRT